MQHKRPSKACDACKRLKRKCDRMDPCSQCKRANVMCVFNTWQTTVANKLQKPEIGPKKNPQNRYDETMIDDSPCSDSQWDDVKISIVREYSSIDIMGLRRVNYGPFSWPSFLGSDPMLSKLEQYILKRRPNFSFSSYNSQVLEESKALHRNPNQEHRTCVHDRMLTKRAFGNQAVDVVVSVALPARLVISRYLDYFFRTLYQLLPIFDETDFKAHILKMLPEDDSPVTSLHATDKLQLARVGSLLVILRLTSLFCRDRNAIDRDAVLIDHPISVSIVEVALEILDQFNLSKHAPIEVLQFVMVIKNYHRFAPETVDGVDDCDIKVPLDIAVFMAKNLGINRDTTHMHHVQDETRCQYLMSKIWYLLIFWDIRRSCISGVPLIIGDSDYDIPFPEYKEGVANVLDELTERRCIEALEALRTYMMPLARIFNSSLNLRSAISILRLTAQIEEHSKVMDALDTEIKAITKQTDAFSLALNLKPTVYLDTKTCFMCYYFLLYLHCEKHCEKNSHRFAHAIEKIITKDLTMMIKVFFYGDGFYDLIFAPSVEGALQKGNIVMTSLLLHQKDSSEKWLDTYAKKFVVFSSWLSKEYCYAWQATKSQMFILDLIASSEFNVKEIQAGTSEEDKNEPAYTTERLAEPSLLEVDSYWLNYFSHFGGVSVLNGDVRYDDLFYSPAMFLPGTRENLM